MSLSVRCTGCGFAFRVADQYAGRRGKCPNCSAILSVSRVALPVAEVLPLARAIDSAREPFTPLQNGSRGRLSASNLWVWPLSTGILAVIVLLILNLIYLPPRFVEPGKPTDTDHRFGPTSLAVVEPTPDPAPRPSGGQPVASHTGSQRPPPPSGVDKAKIAAAKKNLHDLFQKAAAFDWIPSEPGQYTTLENLALAMTSAKEPQSSSELADEADALFSKIKDVGWTGDHIEAINQHAVNHLEKAGEGVVFVGKVKVKQPQPNGDTGFLFFIGSSTPAVVTTSDHSAAGLELDTRLLVFGRITEQQVTVTIDGQHSRVQVIAAHYMFPLM